MIRSANQLANAVYKAWRAAGLSPGCAREVGRAALWLAAEPSELAAVVPPDGFDPARYGPPVRTERGWRIDPACAALHGPSIAELLIAHPDRSVEVGDVDEPGLLAVMLAAFGSRDEVGFAMAGTDPVDVPDEVWERLGRWAERLLVPATEESRAGAGAGAIDND